MGLSFVSHYGSVNACARIAGALICRCDRHALPMSFQPKQRPFTPVLPNGALWPMMKQTYVVNITLFLFESLSFSQVTALTVA